MGNVRVK